MLRLAALFMCLLISTDTVNIYDTKKRIREPKEFDYLPSNHFTNDNIFKNLAIFFNHFSHLFTTSTEEFSFVSDKVGPYFLINIKSHTW